MPKIMTKRDNIKLRKILPLLLLYSLSSNAEEYKDPKIIGGVEAQVGRYPYQVSLVTNRGYSGCGGVLVAPNIVLSAAHCADGNFVNVVIGRHDFRSTSEAYESIQIDSEILHPDYNPYTLENDLMILKLVTCSSYSPIALNDSTQKLSEEVDVTTIGWGVTSFGGDVSSVLMEVELDVISNEKCNDQYGGDITNDMMCAAREGKDSCQGDSGGPLILKGSDAANDVLVGIVSFGLGCAFADYSGVYSCVSENISWIRDKISLNSKPSSKHLLIAKLKNMLI